MSGLVSVAGIHLTTDGARWILASPAAPPAAPPMPPPPVPTPLAQRAPLLAAMSTVDARQLVPAYSIGCALTALQDALLGAAERSPLRPGLAALRHDDVREDLLDFMRSARRDLAQLQHLGTPKAGILYRTVVNMPK